MVKLKSKITKRVAKSKSGIVNACGKRKEAIARATIRPGRGQVRINSILLDNYGSIISRMKIKEPLMIAGDLVSKVNIDVSVTGGGYISQAEAVRLAIARGLVVFSGDEELKNKFLKYDRYLLVADPRFTEPHKSCKSSARRGRQTSKR